MRREGRASEEALVTLLSDWHLSNALRERERSTPVNLANTGTRGVTVTIGLITWLELYPPLTGFYGRVE